METGNTANMAHLVVHEICLQGVEAWSKKPGSLLFVFPSSGKGYYRNSEGARPIGKGDVLFLDAVSEGKLTCRDEGQFAFRTFSLAVEQLLVLSDPSGLRSLHCNNDGQPRIYPARSSVAEAARRVLNRVKPGLGLDSRAQLLRAATSILEAPLPDVSRPEAADVPQRQSAAVQALATLSDEEIVNSSVASLSRKLGFCRRHLNRVFKARYGLTHAAMKRELMLLKAASLLTRSSFKVVQVADDCGFKHPGRFHVWFKKRFGVSPAEWRRISSADGSGVGLRAGADPGKVGSAPLAHQHKGGARAMQFSESSPSVAPERGATSGDSDLAAAEWPAMPLENTQAAPADLLPPGQPGH